MKSSARAIGFSSLPKIKSHQAAHTVNGRPQLRQLLLAALALLAVTANETARADAEDQRGANAQPGTLQEYKLGPQDKVRIKVYSWRASQDQIFEWNAINLNTEYTVGPTGSVSVPLVGEVAAVGLSTAELATRVGNALKERIGMVEQPDVAVEVAQFRPFYVVGDVEKPGEYPYRPGMTVMQAAAIAGGMMRDPRASSIRLEREMIEGEGELNLLVAERLALIGKKARLEAELAGRDEITFPPVLANATGIQADAAAGQDRQISLTAPNAQAAMIIAQEKQIFDARRQAFATSLRALEQLHSYLQQEVESLEAQVKAHETEVSLVHEELESIRQLAEKKLVTDSRRLGLERNRAQTDGDHLRLESSLMRAKQDISKTEIDIIDLRNKRSTNVTAELAEAQTRIDQIASKIQTTESLMSDSETVGSRLMSDRARRRLQVTYTIVRKADNRALDLAATESSSIEPGDTVKIEVVPISQPLATPLDGEGQSGLAGGTTGQSVE
jgi:polysaccharide export outer membrane protein/exopolysaccharide production protein ExoF